MTSAVGHIDPHQDTFTVGIVDARGVEITHEAFENTAAGYGCARLSSVTKRSSASSMPYTIDEPEIPDAVPVPESAMFAGSGLPAASRSLSRSVQWTEVKSAPVSTSRSI